MLKEKFFRFWCQKVLPSIYDDSLSYYELLCKVMKEIENIKETTGELAEVLGADIDELETKLRAEIESAKTELEGKVNGIVDNKLAPLDEKTANLSNGGSFIDIGEHKRFIVFDSSDGFKNFLRFYSNDDGYVFDLENSVANKTVECRVGNNECVVACLSGGKRLECGFIGNNPVVELGGHRLLTVKQTEGYTSITDFWGSYTFDSGFFEYGHSYLVSFDCEDQVDYERCFHGCFIFNVPVGGFNADNPFIFNDVNGNGIMLIISGDNFTFSFNSNLENSEDAWVSCTVTEIH